MTIVVAGGTGFLGQPLVRALAADGHRVIVLTRGDGAAPAPGVAVARWDGRKLPPTSISGAGAVVNLAGESIAGRRWSAAHKRRILDTRIAATRAIVDAIAGLTTPPALISASAIGYYGHRGDEVLIESSAPGRDFLAQVCIAWEAEALRAGSTARVTLIRTGIVLERGGGALDKFMLPFRLFAGGPLGSGRQYMSWIHRDDWIDLVRLAISNARASGPLNATGPNPVTNAAFASALGRAMKRPSFMPTPGFALKIALGEMAGPLLLESQRVLPARAQELGFTFKYPTLPEALAAILR